MGFLSWSGLRLKCESSFKEDQQFRNPTVIKSSLFNFNQKAVSLDIYRICLEGSKLKFISFCLQVVQALLKTSKDITTKFWVNSVEGGNYGVILTLIDWCGTYCHWNEATIWRNFNFKCQYMCNAFAPVIRRTKRNSKKVYFGTP